MRVVIIAPFYRPSVGGVEYIVYRTARGLVGRGFEVHVVSTAFDNRGKRAARVGLSVEGSLCIGLGLGLGWGLRL